MHYGKYKNFFVKASSSSLPNVICFFCNQNGHMVSHCPIRKGSLKVKKICVPKGTVSNVSNPQGPKFAWVPKKLSTNFRYAFEVSKNVNSGMLIMLAQGT